MRIERFERVERDGRVRARAAVIWEDVARPEEEAWLEAPADGFEPGAASFLAGAFVPAMARGERRVRVDAPLCPLLADNVRAAARSLRAWFPDLSAPAVEAAAWRPSAPADEPRAATTMSGGVDSLAAIRANRLALPKDHPHALRDVFFLHGMNTHDFDGDPARERDFEERLARWRPVAEEAGVSLVPVASSFRALATSWTLWARGTLSAGLAAAAHAFPRVTRFLVPSSGAPDVLAPDGTHPMLDPFWSSGALQVVTAGQSRTRLEKLRLVAEWPAALAVLQPCQQHEVGLDTINCGSCNKCRRTMVELEAIGRLGDASSFPRREIDAEFVARLEIAGPVDAACLAECVPLLRKDLQRAAERRLRTWRRRGR